MNDWFTGSNEEDGQMNTMSGFKGFSSHSRILSWAMASMLSAFARVGVNYAEAKDSFAGTGTVVVLNPNPGKREANLKLGLGLQYDFTRSVGMRAEVERYRINDAVGSKGDVDLISIGLVYRFGAGAR